MYPVSALCWGPDQRKILRIGFGRFWGRTSAGSVLCGRFWGRTSARSWNRETSPQIRRQDGRKTSDFGLGIGFLG